LDREVEQRPVTRRLVRNEPGDLPEVRLVLARDRPEGGARNLVLALRQNPEAAAPEDLMSAVFHALEALVARSEHVRNCERGIKRKSRRVTALAHLLAPDRARNVDRDAAAVALA